MANIQKKSMNHLKKNIELYSYVSKPRAKHETLPSLPVPFGPFLNISPFSLRDIHHSEFSDISLFFFIEFFCFTIHAPFLHNILSSYFFLFLNLIRMEWCFMLTCFFNIHFEKIHVDAFNYSLFIFTAAKCSIVCMYHNLFIHSTVDRHLNF